MGLSENKKKSKIPHDPNNHHWSRNTDRFGHKLLVAQGWTPGQKLGAVDASHAEHYTKGSESHIRVTLKDDNRGLGHKLYGPGTGETAETFGLTMFDGLLDRLNGKSKTEAKVKKTKAEADAKTLRMYHARRWGHLTFIRGGFLEREELVQNDHRADGTSSDDPATLEPEDLHGKSRKRKRPTSVELETVKASKRSGSSIDERSQRKKKHKAGNNEDSVTVDKISKKRRKEREWSSEMNSEQTMEKRSKEEERQRKQEKLVKKEQKKQLKEEKHQRKEKRRLEKAAKRLEKETRKAKREDATSLQPEAKTVKVRNMARHKYIQQKKLASLNPQALNEIFMIKSSA